MSRLYKALRQMEKDQGRAADATDESVQPAELLGGVLADPAIELEEAPSAKIDVSPALRFVALTDPRSLGAEKFRALATRLENLRHQRELKCVQISSSVINEGKTLVAANLAATLAKQSDFKVLLVEGDLHRPTLASLLGLTQLPGLSHWWNGREPSITRYVYRLNEMPLWFLGAGIACDQPSQILQSARFAEAFTKLGASFDWIVVDSMPMLPTADANLWSRLVDGMLLVVREGVAPIKAIKNGLAGLDDPKLVGVVFNETSAFDRLDYGDQVVTVPKDGTDTFGSQRKK